VSQVIKTGLRPRKVRDTVGRFEKFDRNVTMVDPPAFVEDVPDCVVVVAVELNAVELNAVFNVTRLLFEYMFALLRFKSAYTSIAAPLVTLLREFVYTAKLVVSTIL
jgi:hypothetical protein